MLNSVDAALGEQFEIDRRYPLGHVANTLGLPLDDLQQIAAGWPETRHAVNLGTTVTGCDVRNWLGTSTAEPERDTGFGARAAAALTAAAKRNRDAEQFIKRHGIGDTAPASRPAPMPLGAEQRDALRDLLEQGNFRTYPHTGLAKSIGVDPATFRSVAVQLPNTIEHGEHVACEVSRADLLAFLE